MFGTQCFCVLTQGEPGYGVKGDKGDTGAPGPQVSDAESLQIKEDFPACHADADLLKQGAQGFQGSPGSPGLVGLPGAKGEKVSGRKA